MNKQENKIGSLINLVKIPANASYEYFFDQNTDWVKEILLELNENATHKSPEEILQETSLSIKGTLEKKNRQDLGEFVLMSGEISTTYATECVRTLQPMKVNLVIPYQICFVDKSLENSEMFQDTDETWIENNVFELYFFEKRTINFKEMVHEQLYLNYNQYPVLDPESPLLGTTESNT